MWLQVQPEKACDTNSLEQYLAKSTESTTQHDITSDFDLLFLDKKLPC